MTETDELQIVQVAPDTVYQQDKASIDIQISTAKAFPRNIKRATDNAIAIATLDVDTAKTCTYSVPRGGKAITGPSVHLAKILAQQWGNLIALLAERRHELQERVAKLEATFTDHVALYQNEVYRTITEEIDTNATLAVRVMNENVRLQREETILSN